MNRPSPDDMNDIIMAELRKENKKLKEELNFYYKAAKQFRKDKDVLMKENEELEKKIETLELRLDNKDKLLEEYRKQIDKLRTIYKEGL